MLKHAKTSPDAISPDEGLEMIEKEHALVLDVRVPDQYEAQHVRGAINIPLERLGESITSLPKDKDAPILCVCNRGNISANGMLYLKSLGYTRVKSLSGGTIAWTREGLPTEP